MANARDKISLFQELVSSVHNIYFSEYDLNCTPCFSTAPGGSPIHLLLSLDADGGREEFMETLASGKIEDRGSQRPCVRSNSFGMMWIATLEMFNDNPYKIHVLGPVFTDDFSINHIRDRLSRLDIPFDIRQETIDFIKSLPVVSMTRFYEYGIMLHYCLTDEKISMSDFVFLDDPEKIAFESDSLIEDRQGTYWAEQSMLKFVQEGNLQYRKEIDRLALFGSIGKISKSGDLIRQAKNSVIIFTTLCCRAAITGGLSPNSAYSLSDRYIQSVEAATSLSSLNEISHEMLDDYIRRVHKIKTNRGISPRIQMICDHISLHPEEKIDIGTLAQRINYTDYYFTKKFKKETGMTVSEFAINQKVEKAKELLLSSRLSISEISDQLGFGSPSYFGDIFKKSVGQSPGSFRSNGVIIK